MKLIQRTMITLIALLTFSTISAASETIRLATLDWEPYIGKTLRNNGYVGELIREAFKRSGYTVTMDFLPWARVVKMAKEGKYDGYFPEYPADNLNEAFLVSNPFPGGPLVFFKRKGETIQFSSLDSLKPYRIGVVRGYINEKNFDAATFLKKDEGTDDLTNLKKLLKKRIDLVVADQFVGSHLIQIHLPDDQDKIDVVDPPLELKDLILCIGKEISDAPKKMDAFNQGLDAIISDGTLNRILKSHGF